MIELKSSHLKKEVVMKKIILFSLVFSLFALAFPNNVLAENQKQTDQQQNNPDILYEEITPSPMEDQVQNQIQTQTQNMGEDQQIQINTQEQENLEAGGENSQSKTMDSRSETARDHMSIVAQEVEKLLTSEERMGGIGDQVREIAQQQKQTQTETEQALNRLESRQGWWKRIVGPDYKAVGNLQRQLEQNQERIRQLEQIRTQLSNQGDIDMIQALIEALVQQNTALEEQIQTEEQAGSLFGWLIKFFVK